MYTLFNIRAIFCKHVYVHVLEQALKIFLNVFDFICINSLQHSLCNVFYILF